MEEKSDEELSASFYTKATAASDELRKSLLALSVAAVGVFFVTLTGHTDRPLSLFAKVAVLVACAAFASAVAFALLTYEYSGRDFHDKAKSGAHTQGKNHELKLRWHNALVLSFLAGVVASVFYVVLRAFHH